MSDFNPGQVRAKLQALKKPAKTGANRGLRLGAEHLLGESLKIVPIEEGTLGRSGKVSVDDGETIAAVSFDTEYAVKQHEDLSLKHDPGRHAKYLETPMNAEGAAVAKMVGDSVKGEMGLK